MNRFIKIGAAATAALIIGIGTAFAASTVVSPTNMNGWYFYNDQTDTVVGTSTDHGFVTGPGAPPAGTGSVHLTKATTDKYGIATAQFASTSLSSITALKYSTYRQSGTAAQAPSLGFDVDSNSNDGITTYEGRLTYEPYFTQTVQTGQWQTWDTLNDTAGTGTGNWWFSHATLNGSVASVCTQANPCTWSELKAAYPNAALRSPGQLILRTNGADGEPFDGNVDNLTVGISGTDTTYDFEPAAAASSSTVTVTIDKFIGGQMATTGSANSSSFPMQSSWNAQNIGAGSGTYDLGPTGFNSNNAYEAVTADMTSGASYSTNEVTGGPAVGASCADNKPYALNGYSTGDSLAAAQSAATSSQSPSFTNITSSKYVIVWNRSCAASTTPPTATSSQVTIIKYVDGTHATTGNASSTAFPFTANYQASNLLGGNAGSDPFTIGPVGNGTPNAYEAMTVALANGASYRATENTGTVAGATCADGKSFALNGYSYGDTLGAAQGAALSSTSPAFTNLQTNKFVIVWNRTCASAPVTPPTPANACDTPTVAPAGYTLRNGTSGSDNVTLTDHTMYVGKGGNDRVSAGNGSYIVCTGSGNDQIKLGNGDSIVDAGGGNNQVDVGNGTTRVTTGSGNDQISTGNGADTVNAGGGNNDVSTHGGNDSLTSGSGNDTLDGGAGNDTCNAGGGHNQKTSCEL